MIGIRWSAKALADLDRIDEFNLTRSAGWARRVQDRIGKRCASLALVPGQGRPIGKLGWRELSIPDIQYVVAYEALDEHVVIHRVRHTRENREAQ